EQHVDGGKKDEHERGPQEKKSGTGPTNTKSDAEQPKRTEHSGGIERAIDESHQQVSAIVQREAQKMGRVHRLAEGGGHHRKKLPEHKDRPQKKSKGFRLAFGNEIRGDDAEQDGPAQSTGGDDNADHDAGKKLERALGGAQGGGEDVPAHLGDGGVVAAFLGGRPGA